MQKRFQLILLMILFLFLLACVDNNRRWKKTIKTTVADSYHKKMVFPDSLFAYFNDTVHKIDNTFFNTEKLKIITFISGDCSPCIQKLYEWVTFHNEIERYNEPQILFIIQYVNVYSFIEKYKQEIPYNYTLVFDPDNKIFLYNHFQTERIFQTVLLNPDNRIIIIGNPVYNKKLKELYITKLKENHHENS